MSLGFVGNQTIGLVFDGLVNFVLSSGKVQTQNQHYAADIHYHVAVCYKKLLEVLSLMEYVVVMIGHLFVSMQHVQSVELG